MAKENDPPSPDESTSVPTRASITRTPRRWRRGRNVLLLVAGVVVISVAGMWLWRYFSSYETTDDAQVDAHLYPVSARISGHVVRVNVEDNEYVKQGTVLVEIDPQDYQVAVDHARADLANAVATAQSLHIDVAINITTTSSQLQSTAAAVETTRAVIAAAEEQVPAAKRQLEEADANDVRAQEELARYKLLVDKEEVARQTYDTALATARSSAAAVTAARANAEAAQHSVEQARSRLASAEA